MELSSNKLRAHSPARRRATTLPTLVILLGLLLTFLILPSESPVAIFSTAAVVVGISLCVASGIEAAAGLRSLIRVDIMMLWLFYALTLMEFLFPQPDVEELSPTAALDGTYAVLLGFAGLTVGRSLVPNRRNKRNVVYSLISSQKILVLFALATLIGYLHILISVNFDLLEAIRQMALPRFSQSWSRGQLGDVYALLYELGMLIGLIPPIAGIIFARAKEFSFIQKVTVAIVLMFTLYYGFSSGTRSVLATYTITFFGAYLLTKPGVSVTKAVMLGLPVCAMLVILTSNMLAFRNVGLANDPLGEQRASKSLYIDRNIVNIARLTEVFPNLYEFLGAEIPLNALIRPIPRALWPSKPEALSVSIESALGVQGLTVSSTYVGEAYMAGGFIGVILFSVLFGASAQLWNRLAANTNSTFEQLLYASGFLCAALAMRSMLSMVPLMLPTMALWLYGRFFALHASAHAGRRTFHSNRS